MWGMQQREQIDGQRVGDAEKKNDLRRIFFINLFIFYYLFICYMYVTCYECIHSIILLQLY